MLTFALSTLDRVVDWNALVSKFLQVVDKKSRVIKLVVSPTQWRWGFLLFLITPEFVIVPTLEASVATDYGNYFWCPRHGFYCLFTPVWCVLLAHVKSFSHCVWLNRDVEGCVFLIFKRFDFYCPRGGRVVIVCDCVIRAVYSDYFKIVVALMFIFVKYVAKHIICQKNAWQTLSLRPVAITTGVTEIARTQKKCVRNCVLFVALICDILRNLIFNVLDNQQSIALYLHN